ncbi:MAG: gliding motility-associated ABC transporter ATP-binding subunit GldA [Flavobacteriales bacterium]
MSISVEHISKEFGDQKALDDVSFSMKGGEVVGFLGPNGAGKSTMMKILTCFIPPTAGKATVCGFDTRDASIQVRKNVGYLPEHNPLYMDMFVREYLRFIAGLHGLDRKKERIERMIDTVGLRPEIGKRIDALSKGYKQRVGLTQALIHEPEVLILDEPTSGLDPNQLSEIRDLIRDIGKERTVLLSTHIMQEVEAICDRVIIVHQGRIVADDPVKELRAKTGGQAAIQIELDGAISPEEFERIDGVEEAKPVGEHEWKLIVEEGKPVREKVFELAVERGMSVLTLHQESLPLEEVFKQLTQEVVDSSNNG